MESTQHYRSPKQRYTLRDVYNAAKFEKHFNYVFWMHVTLDILGEHIMICAGYCLVAMATSLIAGISTLGFLVVIPSITKPGSLAQKFHVVWGVFLVFCIYFNYFLAVLTKPGTPQECSGPQTTPPVNIEQASQDNLKMCKKCNYFKPKRTHHCSICNQCVMKMDHHCPWVSNCVGYRNYRYFVSFLFWVTLAVLYVACISGSKVFSSGSIIFPGPGKPSLFHAVWGGKQRNIYSIIYDLLADPENRPARSKIHNSSMNRKNRTKRLRTHTEDAEKVPIMIVPDTVQSLEERRLQNLEANNNSQIAPALYVDLKVPPMIADEAKLANQRMLVSEPHADATVPAAEASMLSSEKNNHQQQHTRHHSLFPPDHDPWHHGSVLSWIAPDDILIFLAFMSSIGVSFGTGMLLLLHIYLLSSGYTTIEYFESTDVMKHCKKNNLIYKHPYDRGFWANFDEVFGPYPWYLALLPSIREPPPPFYLVHDRCTPADRCGEGLIQVSSAVSTGSTVGQNNSPMLRSSGASGAPLWERNRSTENISNGAREDVDNYSDIEKGGKAHNR